MYILFIYYFLSNNQSRRHINKHEATYDIRFFSTKMRQIPSDKKKTLQLQENSIIEVKLKDEMYFCPLRGAV